MSLCVPARRGSYIGLTPLSDVYNKIDAISLEQMDKLAREDHTVVISCESAKVAEPSGVALPRCEKRLEVPWRGSHDCGREGSDEYVEDGDIFRRKGRDALCCL